MVSGQYQTALHTFALQGVVVVHHGGCVRPAVTLRNAKWWIVGKDTIQNSYNH